MLDNRLNKIEKNLSLVRSQMSPHEHLAFCRRMALENHPDVKDYPLSCAVLKQITDEHIEIAKRSGNLRKLPEDILGKLREALKAEGLIK
jgi:hypothetical protein